MNRERLTETLNLYEACNLGRHRVRDVDHIGWGINLEEQQPDELLEYLGVEDEDDIETITQEQADFLRDYYIGVALNDCHTIYGEGFFSGLSSIRQEVLINLAYNLGLPRLKGFRKMNKAILAGDWKEAAVQMLDSRAAKQTGDRYAKLAGALEHDDETYLELPTRYDTETPESVAAMTLEPGPELATKEQMDARLDRIDDKLEEIATLLARQ